MADLQIFKNPEFGAIRTIERNGEPWFVGKDVAVALGYKDTVNALKSHVDAEDKGGGKSPPPPENKKWPSSTNPGCTA